MQWQVKHHNDLSGVWLECNGRGYELCIDRARNGEFGYWLWVHLDENVSSIDPLAIVGTFHEIDEAKEVGEAIVRQWAWERFAEVVGG
jgi:hypothetical protein